MSWIQLKPKNLFCGISEIISNDKKLVSQLVVDNVQYFENETDGVLEYTDNDTTKEVSGEENNFDTSIQIWVDNRVSNEIDSINTVPVNTVIPEEMTNTVDNTVTNEVTNNTAENEVTNNLVSNNTVANTVQNTVDNTVDNSVQNEVAEEQTTESQPEENQQLVEEQVNIVTQNPVIEEEDNFRTQGYIEVNENTGYSENNTEFIIGEDYKTTITNIANWIESIEWSTYIITGAKANITQTEFLENLQKILEDRYEQENSLIIKIYVSDGKTVKINFEIPETSEYWDFEIVSKGENEKYLNITYLLGKDEDSSGNTISIYKKNTDAIAKSKITVNKIYKNKISQKTVINLQTKGTMNAQKYITEASLLYSASDGEFKLQVDNILDFNVSRQIEDLNNDNCLFIDTMPDEEMRLNVDAIKEKTISVLNEKNRNLNIIDINNSNSIVQQNQQQNIQNENIEEKNKAKQALIQTISEKMGQYQAQGNSLKITDLEGLQISGYDVQISISSNLAIITVNGYKFKLDSDFNLSDS